MADKEVDEQKLKTERLKEKVSEVWDIVGDNNFEAAGISPEFIEVIFLILNDHTTFAPSEIPAINNTSIESKKPLDYITWEESYCIALKSCSRILKLLVLADPHECKVDSPSVVKRLLEVIKSRSTCQKHNIHSVVKILDSLVLLLDEDSTNILQEILIGVSCFDYLITGFTALTNNKEEQNQLFVSCTRAIATVTYGSSASKEVFKASVGYDKLGDLFKNLQEPSDDFILTLVDWAVEGHFREGELAINNVDVILMMLDWLPSTNLQNQRFATERLRELCEQSTRNAMLCSVNRVFGKIVNILDSYHQTIDKKWADCLIKVLEELGSFSVSASELKQMISLFRPLEDGTKTSFTHHLLQVLLKVSCSGSKKRAQYYFDLHNKFAGISVSSIQRWVGSGFTFFTWLCLEPEVGKVKKRRPKNRRTLYSFFSSSGIGIEAFLSGDRDLVVATRNKNKYHSVEVGASNLVDGQWHSVSIAHLPSRRLFSHSTVCISIDGAMVTRCHLKFPSLSEELSHCYIGSGTALASPPAGTQDMIWGVPTSLHGQLGPICIFNEGLGEYYHTAWHNAGPNSLDIFQPPDSWSQASLYEISSKLVLYYHAKAVRDSVCYDLTPPQATHTPLHGRLSGHQCVTWNIKDVIQTIGGVEIFLPLLEVIQYKDKESDSKSDDKMATTLDSTNNERTRANNSELDNSHGNGVSKETTETNSDTSIKGLRQSNQTSHEEIPQNNFTSGQTGSHLIEPQESQAEEWTIIDPRADIDYLRKEMTKYCETSTCTDVSLFMYLILNIFKENESIDSVHGQSISFIAHMLESCDPRLLDVDVLKPLQAMIVTSPHLKNQIYQHLVFNFRIWNSCYFSVRVGHIQYLSTIIKDNPALFKKSYGVQFFLDVVRMYYAGEHKSLGATAEPKRAGAVEITEQEVKTIRASLLGLVKFYLEGKPLVSEAKCLVQYLQSVQDVDQVLEILELLNSLCSTSSTNKLFISDPSNVCVFVSILHNFALENIRLKVLKLMGAIVTSPKVPEVNKDAWRLKDVGLRPLTDVLENESSISIVLGLLELGVMGLSEVKGVQVYGYCDVVLAVVKMVLNKDLHTKLRVSHMILRSLDASRQSHVALAREPAWYDYLLRLLTVPSRDHIPSDLQSDEAVFIRDLVNTVLDILFRVMWRGVQGYDEEAWKNRGQVIAGVRNIASTEIFLYPSRFIERELLEASLQAAVKDIQRSGQTGASETQNALMVMRLVEDFLFTSVSFTGQEIEDTHTWSEKLVQSVAQLLEVLNVWGEDDSEETTEWEEMTQIGGRILLGFISRKETEFCATASSKLSKLLKARTINSQVELCYVLGKLYNAFVDSRQKGTTNFTFILPVIRLIVLKYREQLPLSTCIPSFTAPDQSQPKFEEEFIKLAETEEFKALMRQQVIPAIRPYENQCSDSSVASGRFWMDCLNGLTTSLQRRDTNSKTSSDRYQQVIIEEAQKVLKNQEEHMKNHITQRNQQSAMTARDWLIAKRRLTSERSAWANRCPEEVHWKLSTTENFQRMRLKLCRNYNFTNHAEASQKRDNTCLENGNVDGSSVPVHVAKEAFVQGSVDAIDVVIPNNTASPPTSPQRKRPTFTEKVEVKADFITLMEIQPGRLKISTTHVYFTANRNGQMAAAVQDFAWALTELREVHLRRHNLRRTALEFFLVDHTNYFINFSKEDRKSVYKRIMSLRPPNLYYMGTRSPVELLKASGLTDRWVRREISTFEYLMQLNTIAGRTYNDLSQYPVFPWILTDYKSKELDLNNPAVYRDLSKPVGALNPEKAEEVREKYESFDDPTGEMPKFHYGTHYSNSAGVLFYLLRVEPFTTLHIELQHGRFDHADRQFQNIPIHWDSIYMGAPNDLRELIPEFFYFPEFLENLNRFDIGRLQDGTVVDHVILPPWAKTSEEFVYKHRAALESEYVSMNIHNWIDLIFGYKQRGQDAEDALNVFSYYTYEGAVDFDAITDPNERESAEGMVKNFGQTPTQLLTEPHPQRMTQQETSAYKNKALENASTTRLLPNVFDGFEKLNSYFVEVSDIRDPLVFTAVPKIQAHGFIHHGMPDTMVTVSRRGVLGAQDWLPYSKTKSRPFTFELELDSAWNSPKLRRTVAAPFAPDLNITCRLFAITSDARLVFTGGHWDSTIRVFTPKGEMLSRIRAHSDVVTCLALDNDGRHLITGSRDTTCRVWSVTDLEGWATDIDKTPFQTLYGHDREITCVAISWEMDLVVSGSEDGTCIIHTARKGEYVRTLRPMNDQQSSTPGLYRVSSLAISEYGNIVLFCYGRDRHALCRYSINGQLLDDERTLKDDVTTMTVYGEYVVTGGSGGRLSIRELHGLKEVKSIKLRTSITSVSLAKDNSHIFVTLIDGKLIIIAVNNTS